MKNIVLAPVIVIGCAVLGVIGGAVYFGAVIGVLDWLTGAASAADDLGRRASFPAFAFGVPAGAVIGVRLSNALRGGDETVAEIAAAVVAGLVALPCIVLPLYASFMPACKVLASAGHTAPILGYLPVLGIGAFAFGSNMLVDACTIRRASSTR